LSVHKIHRPATHPSEVQNAHKQQGSSEARHSTVAGFRSSTVFVVHEKLGGVLQHHMTTPYLLKWAELSCWTRTWI